MLFGSLQGKTFKNTCILQDTGGVLGQVMASEVYKKVIDIMTQSGVNPLKAIYELQTYCEESKISTEDFDYGHIKEYRLHFSEPEHVKNLENKVGALAVKKIMRRLEKVVEAIEK
ncbi:MAG: hypothetical protein PHC66_01970 [Candidatus Nanoarchaeia archaeon]|nr:hypothetical protein [Candidatus Nanoarchaeia archaeon]MDD5239055.1 hypothetical protein [Candidatus Nanoarchaeia archaeon]